MHVQFNYLESSVENDEVNNNEAPEFAEDYTHILEHHDEKYFRRNDLATILLEAEKGKQSMHIVLEFNV